MIYLYIYISYMIYFVILTSCFNSMIQSQIKKKKLSTIFVDFPYLKTTVDTTNFLLMTDVSKRERRIYYTLGSEARIFSTTCDILFFSVFSLFVCLYSVTIDVCQEKRVKIQEKKKKLRKRFRGKPRAH